MLLYCLMCRKNTESKNSNILKTENVSHLLEVKKEYKNLKKQEIHDIFIKTN